MKIKKWVYVLLLITAAATLFADEPLYVGGEREAARLPYYLAEYAKEKPYPSISICKESFADARVILIIETRRWSSSAREGVRYFCSSDELLRKIDDDPEASLGEYRLLEKYEMGGGFAYELRLIREKKKGYFGGDTCLSVIRRGREIVWFRAFTGHVYIKKGLLAAVPHPDAVVLRDGRYMVATPGETFYIKRAAGKLLVSLYEDTRPVWYDGIVGSAGYIPPWWYPAVTILTENVVRMTYPDGTSDHWKVILSEEETALNEERRKASDTRGFITGEGRLLWWNGKGRMQRFGAEEMQNRSYREGGPEPSYPGMFRRPGLSEIKLKEYMKKAPDFRPKGPAPVQPVSEAPDPPETGKAAAVPPEPEDGGTFLTRLAKALSGRIKGAADCVRRLFGGSLS
ncbi:MAG: hypothetical protein ILO36_04895 [Abditibacteriota bacterium]|nr:hypothetical protein [Abditibacteriota bacterium]